MTTIHIIGAGGTGSLLAPIVARWAATLTPVPTIRIWDPDTIERRNLVRQAYGDVDIGTPKAEALAARIRDLGVEAFAMQRIVDLAGAEMWFSDGDAVCICVDNYPTRRAIDEIAAKKNDILVVNGGNERDAGSTQVFIRRNAHNITPRISHMHPEIGDADPTEYVRAQESCIAHDPDRPGDAEQTLAANLTSAAQMFAMLSTMWDVTDYPGYSEICWNLRGQAQPMDWSKTPGWQ